MHSDGLHYHDCTNREIAFVQMVKQNEEGYSQQQLQQARLAKDVYAKVGHPSQHDFKAMVAGEMILNCPVNLEDVTRAVKIYGPSNASLKGKTARQSPDPVETDLINITKAILEANANVSLSGDVFFVNKIPFFTTISQNTKCTMVGNIPSRTNKQFVEAAKHVIAL
jgi:hypothetical protein